MRSFQIRSFISILIHLSPYIPIAVSSPLQFCHVDQEKHTDLCMGLASYSNASSSSNDIVLTISARLESRQGWAGIGMGETMNDALFFVLYPGAEWGDVTVSVRSTNSHEAPKPETDAPSVDVIKSWVNAGDLYNAQLVCHGCSSWKKHTADEHGWVQPWLWAVNADQPSSTADVGMLMFFHTDHGAIDIDMSTSYSTQELQTFPKITHERTSINIAPGLQGSSTKFIVIHATLSISGVLTLVAGVLALRSGTSKSFPAHWLIQVSGTGVFIMGSGTGILISRQSARFWHFDSLHQILGFAITGALAVQVGLGWKHHADYLKHGGRTRFSDYHVVLGRTILVSVNVNILLGLKLAGGSRLVYLLWSASMLMELALLISMWYYGRGKEPHLSKENAKRAAFLKEQERELFIISE